MNTIRKALMNKKSVMVALIALILVLIIAVVVAYFALVPKYRLGQPLVTQIGTFDGIAYIQYDGIFEGETSTGAFRVPYRITAPAAPLQGNQTILVEPSHFAAGLGALDFNLGRDFLFSRGFAHAGIGWSTTTGPEEGMDLRILDPKAPGIFIKGGFVDENGRTDDEIIIDFARALMVDPVAKQILGHVNRRYITGFSDSSNPIFRLIISGRATGVFDFALPFTTDQYDLQTALATNGYDGKLIIVNSEFEGASANFVNHGGTLDKYRFFAIAGTPHIPDFLEVPFFTAQTTPASFQPELRAHFLQGHDWVMDGTQPPLSTHLKTSDDVTLERDANRNAIVVDTSGQIVPRLPFIELGEAHYITTPEYVGSYEDVITIKELGFENHNAYLQAFEEKLANYVKARYILQEDADTMLRRAALCPSLTFTEMYRDHYDEFIGIVSCGG